MSDQKTMDIKIIHVEVTDVPKKTGKGSYKQAHVTYENLTFNGKTDGRKLMDWATPPEVWTAMANAKHGDMFRITYEKNERGFNDWKVAESISSVEAVQDMIKDSPAKTPAATRAAKGEKVAGTWDEKNKLDRERFEFDKQKQGLIIRQSSLSTAATVLTAGGNQPTLQEVVDAAIFFEEYVNSAE